MSKLAPKLQHPLATKGLSPVVGRQNADPEWARSEATRPIVASRPRTTLIDESWDTVSDSALDEQRDSDPIPSTVRLTPKSANTDPRVSTATPSAGERPVAVGTRTNVVDSSASAPAPRAAWSRSAERLSFFAAGLVAGAAVVTTLWLAVASGYGQRGNKAVDESASLSRSVNVDAIKQTPEATHADVPHAVTNGTATAVAVAGLPAGALAPASTPTPNPSVASKARAIPPQRATSRARVHQRRRVADDNPY